MYSFRPGTVGLGFRISDLVFRVEGFGFRICLRLVRLRLVGRSCRSTRGPGGCESPSAAHPPGAAPETSRCRALGVRGYGLRFRVQGSGFRVQGLGFRVQGSGNRVHVSGFRCLGV